MLYFAMLNVAPRPALYYGWIVGLITVLAVLLPFTGGLAVISAAALAGINLLVGLMILTLMPFAAVNAGAAR